jgi:primosomal protein N' (replication factor Y)
VYSWRKGLPALDFSQIGEDVSLPSTVQVAVDVPLWETFSYLTNQPLQSGQRVQISFGPRILCGIVTNTELTESGYAERLKTVDRVFDELPPLPAEFLALVRFASTYYHHPFGQTLFTALPTSLREPKAVRLLDRRGWRLTAQGADAVVPVHHKVRHALFAALSTDAVTETAALRSISPQSGKTMDEWQEKGWVERVAELGGPLLVAAGPELNPEQRSILDLMGDAPNPAQPWVLHGVTGSGKTEVYLQLIARQLEAGRQVLVLVPEINLTPQLIARFTQRFPQTPMSLLHSNLADGERLNAWVDAWQGRAGIVIGTRLSVFTPLPRLGLIVVDEEHDASFKQQDGLRYHARDLAVWRARKAGVPIVLGSATPCLETMANVEAGRYRRLQLLQRAHHSASLPAIRLVDVRRQKRIEGMTDGVVEALRQRVKNREMSLVYINRRGFAPVVACPDCGWTSGCPRCSAKLVVHLMERKLRCHHCGWEEGVPHVCPDCGNQDIKPLGEGTQRLEAALERLLPEARILRIDRDTTQRKDAWNEIYRKVQNQEVDILVGTQMLAKGHDFGSLSLVVILNADAALYAADYRASERLFAQLMQVSGRAGRADTPGEVLLQTQWPEHPLYQALVAHDYDRYAFALLNERRQAGFPPASFQAVLRADATTLDQAVAFLQTVREQIEPLAGEVLVCGPAPALMVKLANRERAQLVLESPRRSSLHTLLDHVARSLQGPGQNRAVRWSLDVDPQEM